MSAMFEPCYRIKDNEIQELIEGECYYDVDWGYRYEPNYWKYLCDNTPENRKKYGL